VEADFSQSAQNRDATVIMTANYLGGAPANWTLLVPNLSAAGGFNNTWGLANAPFDWCITGLTGQVFLIDHTTPADGATSAFAHLCSTSPVSSIVAASFPSTSGLIRMPTLEAGGGNRQ